MEDSGGLISISRRDGQSEKKRWRWTEPKIVVRSFGRARKNPGRVVRRRKGRESDGRMRDGGS